MTTATHLPATIRATIDQSAIARVPSFFNAGIGDILQELFQNARRAGASHINVRQQDGIVTVSDDGSGITDPQALLAFGRTEWEREAIRNEHPAGMGLYSLARRPRVTVRSATKDGLAWNVRLTTRHFTGEEEATVNPDPDPSNRAGTTVQFDWNDDADKAVRAAARYAPTPVTFNEETVEQVDFLTDALAIQEWRGLRIGVHPARHRSTSYAQLAINFHGKIVPCRDYLPTVPTLDGRPLEAWVDVVDCPDLILTLPARQEIVRTPFLDEMRDAALKTIYSHMARSESLIHTTKEAQNDARRLGVHIPDPPPQLRPWRPTSEQERHNPRRTTRIPGPQSFILDDTVDRAMQHAFDRAQEITTPLHVLQADDLNLAGYDWYDAIRRITDITAVARYGEQQFQIPQQDEDPQFPHQRPDAIAITLHVREPSGDESTISIQSDVALPDDEDHSIYDVAPLVTRDAGISSHELAELMMAAYFWPDDDGDSYQTQLNDSENEARRNAESLLLSHDAAVANSIAAAVAYTGIRSYPPGTTAVLTVGPGRTLTVDINRAETDLE